MRKFLVTSPAWQGEAEIVYDQSGRLISLSNIGTNMSTDVISSFKKRVPAHIDNMSEAFTGTQAVVVETDFNVSVDDFLHEYPYARNTHLTREYWPKMSRSDQVLAWMAAKDYADYCKRNSKWYKPKIADTWLKHKEYLNNWKTL